jgi:hypothetical protein
VCVCVCVCVVCERARAHWNVNDLVEFHHILLLLSVCRHSIVHDVSLIGVACLVEGVIASLEAPKQACSTYMETKNQADQSKFQERLNLICAPRNH